MRWRSAPMALPSWLRPLAIIVLVLTLRLAGGGSAAASGIGVQSVQNVSGTSDLTALACPTFRLCLAIGTNANVYPSRVVVVPLAVADDGGLTVGAAQPVSGVDALHGIACPSPTLCLASGGNGSLGVGAVVPIGVSATGVSIGAALVVTGARNLLAIACPSGNLCVAIGWGSVAGSSDVVVPFSTDSSGIISEGSVQSVATGTSLAAISCPTLTTCLAVGSEGNPLVGAVAPISIGDDGGVSVGASQLVVGANDLNTLACATNALCLAGGGVTNWEIAGSISPITLRNGTIIGIGSAQKTYNVSTVLGLACVTAATCVGVGTNGVGVTTAVTIGGDGSLGIADGQEVDNTADLEGVACPVLTICVGVGSANVGLGVGVVAVLLVQPSLPSPTPTRASAPQTTPRPTATRPPAPPVTPAPYRTRVPA